MAQPRGGELRRVLWGSQEWVAKAEGSGNHGSNAGRDGATVSADGLVGKFGCRVWFPPEQVSLQVEKKPMESPGEVA